MQGKRWLVLVIVAVVAIVGFWLWHQYSSGAWEAQRSLDSLLETSEEWKNTDVTTRYEQSEGLVIQSAEAALSRGGDPAQVWANTYSAATQGAAAYTDALNAEYDAQYAALQLLDDTVAGTDGLTERQRALAELTAWYNEQAAQGTREYYDTLAQVLDLTGEGMFGDGGEYTETAGRLERINTLMDELSQTTDTTTRNKLTTELANELKELDETQIVELTSALTSMQAAAEQSGVELDETYAGVLEDIQAIKQSLNVNEDTFGADLLESLQNMFGENLDNEVLQVYGALNFDSLESSYKAWAEGEHADIIPTINTGIFEAKTNDLSALEAQRALDSLSETAQKWNATDVKTAYED